MMRSPLQPAGSAAAALRKCDSTLSRKQFVDLQYPLSTESEERNNWLPSLQAHRETDTVRPASCIKSRAATVIFRHNVGIKARPFEVKLMELAEFRQILEGDEVYQAFQNPV